MMEVIPTVKEGPDISEEKVSLTLCLYIDWTVSDRVSAVSIAGIRCCVSISEEKWIGCRIQKREVGILTR